MGWDTSQLGKDKNASESHAVSYRGVTLRNSPRRPEAPARIGRKFPKELICRICRNEVFLKLLISLNSFLAKLTLSKQKAPPAGFHYSAQSRGRHPKSITSTNTLN